LVNDYNDLLLKTLRIEVYSGVEAGSWDNIDSLLEYGNLLVYKVQNFGAWVSAGWMIMAAELALEINPVNLRRPV
jgi:hypothetical protein